MRRAHQLSAAWPSRAEQAVELVERARSAIAISPASPRPRALLHADLDRRRERVGQLLFDARDVARLLTLRAQQRRLPRAGWRAGARPASRPRARSASWRRSRWPRGSGARRRARSSARAWPISRSPTSSICCTGSLRLQQAQQVAGGAARAADGAAPPASWVRPNSSVRRLQAARLLERVEVLALDVLDQRHRRRGLVGHVAHQHRHVVEAGEPGGADAPLAGDDLVALRRRARLASGRTSTGCITPCALMLSASS